jgi:ParB family chromosome partitioning protein
VTAPARVSCVLEVSKVVVPKSRLRPLGDVTALMESIQAVGVLQPIVITADNRLVSGAHRLEACKRLGLEKIPATVVSLDELHARLAEIDENLCRNDLSPLERAEHGAERERIIAAAELRAVSGGDGRPKKTPDTVSGVTKKTTADIGAELGVSGRTVQRDAKIAAIPQGIRDAIRNTPVADSTTQLLELAKQTPERQQAIVEKIASGEAKTVMEATGGTYRTAFTGDVEWYTPAEYIETARAALGAIDLDPASNDVAQKVVKAARYFTATDDGLKKAWDGRVWLNPPYSRAIVDFVAKLIAEVDAGRTKSAILLTNNSTDTGWFHDAASKASAICFTRGRISFWKEDGEKAAPLQGSAFFFFGHGVAKFAKAFADVGLVVEVRR